MEALCWNMAIALTGSLLCIFFGYGGIPHRKRFFKLCRRKGKWRIQWLGIIFFYVLTAFYVNWLFGLSRESINLLLLTAYLGAVTLTDLRSRQIPDDATLCFGILFILWGIAGGNVQEIMGSIAGAGAGAAIPFIVYFFRKDAIGLGDIKLLACCGLLIGFPGIAYMILRAMVLGAVFSLLLLLRRKGHLKTELPFAPFALLAVLI